MMAPLSVRVLQSEMVYHVGLFPAADAVSQEAISLMKLLFDQSGTQVGRPVISGRPVSEDSSIKLRS